MLELGVKVCSRRDTRATLRNNWEVHGPLRDRVPTVPWAVYGLLIDGNAALSLSVD